MKPMNFPERKRQRRMDALARLVKHGWPGKPSRAADEADLLKALVAFNRRDTKSKKRRSGLAAFTRQPA